MVIMSDSNFSACTFVIVTLFHLRACDIALHREAFMFSNQFSTKFLNRHVLSLASILF